MTYKWIGANAYGGKQTTVDRIVMHATVSPCTSGRAESDGNYLNRVGLSAHYLVDPTTVVQMLQENVIGYHDGHNVNEIGIELCDPQAGSASRWSDAPHQLMLAKAAELVAGIAKRWNVPVYRIQADLRVPPTRGICGHVDVTNTWHESTHVDPDHAGPFPWNQFIAAVAAQGAPAPAAQNGDELQMASAEYEALKDQISNVEALLGVHHGAEQRGTAASTGSYFGDRMEAGKPYGTSLRQVVDLLNKIASKIGA